MKILDLIGIHMFIKEETKDTSEVCFGVTLGTAVWALIEGNIAK